MYWPPISEWVGQFIAVSVCKFHNGLAPVHMEYVFKNNPSLRCTRFSDESKLSIPNRNHNYGKNCLSYRGATIWNSLEIKIKEAQSCNSFKHLVKDRFFSNLKLKEENAYIYWYVFYFFLQLLIRNHRFYVFFLLHFVFQSANSFWRGPQRK